MRRKNEKPEYTARHAAGEPAATPEVEEEKSSTTEFPSVSEEPTMQLDGLIPPVQDDEEDIPAPKKKRFRWFWRRKEEPAEAVAETATEEVEAAEETDVPDDTREISLSGENGMDKTRVIEMAEDGGSNLADDEPAQMLLEGFGNEEEDTEQEPGQEETLRRIRQEKIQDFSQRREQHERELAEAEQAAQTPPPEETVEEEEPAAEIEEEVPVQETLETVSLSAVRERLKQQVHRSGITLVLSVLAELILFFITAVSVVSPAMAMEPMTYLIIHIALFLVLVLASGSQLLKGVSMLFTKHRLTGEGALAVVALITVLHTVSLALNPTGVADGSAVVLTGVAGFGLLLLQIAYRLELNRVVHDFTVFSKTGEKVVAKRITDDVLAEEIGRPAVPMGMPRVAYFRTTVETEGYVDAEGYDPSVGLLKWYFPFTLCLSLAVAVVYLLLNGGFTAWVMAATLFCSLVTVSAPVMMLIAVYAALYTADKKTRKQGTAIADYRAVETYGSSDAIALDAMELFPENSVLLHGIKTFSGTRIDEAILDAASVSVRAGGPLSHVFRRMIQNKVDMLHEVDTLVYEQGMGLSGWISGRRILIGNRKLLDNHGIDIPSKDYEDRYAKNGRQLVYLSIAGELSAMFVVSYTADDEVGRILKTITDRHITLLIRTCDQNVTEALVTSVFGLDGYYVELLSAPAGRSFETLVSGVSETETAEIVSTGSSTGILSAIAKCRRLRTGVRLFAALQAIIGILGVVLFGLVALSGQLIAPISAIEYLLGGTVLLSLIALLFSKR